MWALKPILDGMWQGLLMSLLSFGPAFFLLINTSIRDGFKKGLLLAVGVLLADLAVILAIYFGIGGILENIMFKKVFALSAGIAMIFMGINAMRSPYKAFLKSYYKRGKAGVGLLKGFAMNILNPSIIAMWMIVMSSVSLNYEVSKPNYNLSILVNLISILVFIFALDTSKVYLSSFLGKKLDKRIFYNLNKYMGYILIAIGMYFLYSFLLLMEIPHTDIRDMLKKK